MRRLATVGLVSLLYGCPQPHDSAVDTHDTYISDTDTDMDADSDTDSDTDADSDTDTDQNHAPEITNTSLSSAVVNTAYSSAVTARDVDKDTLTYSLTTSPSWLHINSTNGSLSGTPTATGNYNVTASVTDGLLNDAQNYILTVASLASLDLYVINGDNGASADSSCSIDVVLTNTSGYSETATMNSSGVAVFSLDEIGTYDISVASTNTGSNCYGGFSHAEWLDVSSGTNSSWVVLIPESYQNDVVSVVGSQLDMSARGLGSGNVDSVRDLFLYMLSVNPYVSMDSYGWEDSIRDGTTSLTVDTIDWTYQGIQYNDGLQLAISYWDGHLAPSVQQVSSGGEIWFTRTSNWQADPDYSDDSHGVWTIDDVEIDYTAANDVYDIAMFFAHEMGHAYFNHTNVSNFIMDSSPSVDEPHELELLIARVFTNVGNATPRTYPLQLDGYNE